MMAARELFAQWLTLCGMLFLAFLIIIIITLIYRGPYRWLIYNISFVFLAFGIGEFVLSRSPAEYFEGSYTAANYFSHDRDLGYLLTPGDRHVRSVKKERKDGATIYDVEYHINDFGFRDTPNYGDKRPVFFFGDSFTFGEGVNDADTLPAQFSKVTGRKTSNFGVHGYGPHQFLRILETQRLETLGIRDRPELVVYTFIPHQIDRAAGHAPWDSNGPLYQFSSVGLVYRGSFKDNESLLQWIMNKSFTYQMLRSKYASSNEEEMDRLRTLAILQRSGKLVKDRYGVEMLVILWDVFGGSLSGKDADRVAWLADNLSKSGIQNLRLSRLESVPQGRPYYLPRDGHPNGAAYALVAKAIAEYCSKEISYSQLH